jgi:hypothetical protein
MTPEEAFIQATKFRAKAYFYFFDELSEEIGEEKAKEVLSKATYRLGIDKAGTFIKESEASAKILSNEFIKDEIGRNVFGQTVINGNDEQAAIEMKSCPLVEMWKEMKLSKDVIQNLCDMAHQIDFGTVEGKGFNLKFSSRISYGNNSCILEISK